MKMQTRKKPTVSKVTSKTREAGAKLKGRMGATMESAKATTAAPAKTTSIRAKSAISRTSIGTTSSKKPARATKKATGAKTVSTIHLIGKRGEGARTPAVTR
jgi:hypothetical protein